MTTKTLQNKGKKGKFQAIPARQASDPVAEAIAENLEILTGMRGAGGKKAVLWEDLESLNFASMDSKGKVKSLLDLSKAGNSGNKGTGTGTGTTPVKVEVDDPTTPTSVRVSSGFGVATLDWTPPPYRGHAYAEIYIADVDDFTQAVKINTTPANIISITLPQSGTFYLWVDFVNLNGKTGPIQSIAGLKAQSKADPQFYLDMLKQQINDNPDLFGGTIDLSKYAQIYSVEELDRIVAEGVLENAVTEDIQTSIRRTENQQLSASIKQNYYTITDADQAIAAAITTLRSDIEDPDGNSLGARLTNSYQTKANANEAYASLSQQLSATQNQIAANIEQVISASTTNRENYEALWGIKASVGDLKAGVGLLVGAKDGVESAVFTVKNAQFRVAYDREQGGVDGEDIVPVFGTIRNPDWEEWKAQKDAGNFEDGDEPDEPVKFILAINTANIKVADIQELVAGNVIADSIVANSEILSPIIKTPRINDSNSNFFVDETGLLAAKNANIEGHIVAKSGSFPVSLMTGKLTANQVVAEDFVLQGQTLTATRSIQRGTTSAAANKVVCGTLTLNNVVKASNYQTTLILTYTGTIINSVRKGNTQSHYRPSGLVFDSYIRLQVQSDGGAWRNIGAAFKLTVQSVKTGRHWEGGGDSGSWRDDYAFWYSEMPVYLSTTIPATSFGKDNNFRVVSTTGDYQLTNQQLFVNLGRA